VQLDENVVLAELGHLVFLRYQAIEALIATGDHPLLLCGRDGHGYRLLVCTWKRGKKQFWYWGIKKERSLEEMIKRRRTRMRMRFSYNSYMMPELPAAVSSFLSDSDHQRRVIPNAWCGSRSFFQRH
jgi:hypothetical protein